MVTVHYLKFGGLVPISALAFGNGDLKLILGSAPLIL